MYLMKNSFQLILVELQEQRSQERKGKFFLFSFLFFSTDRMNTTHTREEEEEEEEEEENNNRKNMGPRSRSRPRPPRPYLSFFFFLITCQSSIIATILVVNGDLHRGDIVPTSSRMHLKSSKQRTQWMDVLEKHCPSFGRNKMVAYRVEKPTSHSLMTTTEGEEEGKEQSSNEIKIQFAFDNERHFTVWMPIRFSSSVSPPRTTTTKGKEKKIPMITFTFTHHAGYIVNVKSESSFIERKGAKKQLHQQHYEALAEEWSSTLARRSEWPKHVLLKYEFIEKESVDVNKGLGVLMSFMLLVFVASVSRVKMDEDDSGEDGDSNSKQKGGYEDEAPNVIVGANTSEELVRRQARRASDFI